MPPALTAVAASAQLSANYDVAANLVTLTWKDSFPSGTAYAVQSQQPGGTFTNIATVIGSGTGSNLSWTGAGVGNATMRVQAIQGSWSIDLQTAAGQLTLPLMVPASSPMIVLVNQGDPVTGLVRLAIPTGFPPQLAPVAWFIDGRSIGTSTSEKWVPWNTDNDSNGTHTVTARVNVSDGSYTELRRTVQVNNVITMSLSTRNGSQVDVVTQSPFGILNVTLRANDEKVVLTQPNSCVGFTCTVNPPSTYAFPLPLPVCPAEPAPCEWVITVTDNAGNTRSTDWLGNIGLR